LGAVRPPPGGYLLPPPCNTGGKVPKNRQGKPLLSRARSRGALAGLQVPGWQKRGCSATRPTGRRKRSAAPVGAERPNLFLQHFRTQPAFMRLPGRLIWAARRSRWACPIYNKWKRAYSDSLSCPFASSSSRCACSALATLRRYSFTNMTRSPLKKSAGFVQKLVGDLGYRKRLSSSSFSPR